MSAAAAGAPDAELVGRVLAADREAFAEVYDRYGDRLFDFAHSMLRHREDAADAVADAFVTFAERLQQLRDPSRLRPWLYAIVRSECLRRLKARKRVAFGDEDRLTAMADDAATPTEVAERADLQQLVWDAAAGLAERDRAMLDLHLRHGLEGAELGEAMGVSAANAYVMLNRLRAQVDRSLGALLVARRGREECAELDGILSDWDGSYSPLVRKRVARHVERCEVCSARRKQMVSPLALLAAVPLLAAPAALRTRVLGDTQLVAYVTPTEQTPGSLAATSSATEPAASSGGSGRGGRAALGIAAAILLVLAGIGTTMLWPRGTAPVATTEPQLSPPPSTLGSQAPLSPRPSPTHAPSPSSTPTATPTPGQLLVSAHLVDLGRRDKSATIGLSNGGGLPVHYTASTEAPWLDLSPTTGQIDGGRGTDLVLTADRSALPEGAADATLTLAWDHGTATVQVKIDVERPPEITSYQFTERGCDAYAAAQVTDESGLASVSLVWTRPSSGEQTTQMTSPQGGDTWSAALGPFIGSADITAHVTATDKRGNTSTSAPITVHVVGCPA